jgi:hypothetical protein
MKVASILNELFKDMTLTFKEYSGTLKTYKTVTKSVQFHWGDNKELAKWITGRGAKQKYPLIWYVIEPVDNSNGNTFISHCSLYLFTSTKNEYYNNTRALINYYNIIDPLEEKVMRAIEENNVITPMYDSYEKFYTSFDIPNFGLDMDKFDFSSNLPKGTMTVTLDILDARKLEFQARFVKPPMGSGGSGEGGGEAGNEPIICL